MGGTYHPQLVGLWHRVSHIIHPSMSALGKVAVSEDHFQQITGDTPTRWSSSREFFIKDPFFSTMFSLASGAIGYCLFVILFLHVLFVVVVVGGCLNVFCSGFHPLSLGLSISLMVSNHPEGDSNRICFLFVGKMFKTKTPIFYPLQDDLYPLELHAIRLFSWSPLVAGCQQVGGFIFCMLSRCWNDLEWSKKRVSPCFVEKDTKYVSSSDLFRTYVSLDRGSPTHHNSSKSWHSRPWLSIS